MDFRFAITAALAVPPIAALTLLLLHADQRVRAIDARDVQAAGYNLAVTAWNARQVSAKAEGVVTGTQAAVDAAKPALEAVTRRINELPAQELTDAVVNLRDAIYEVQQGAGPVLKHADELVLAAKPSVDNAGRITGEIAGAAPAVHNTLDVLSENADLLGRCEFELPDGTYWGNPDCFANRAIPAMKAFENSSIAFGRFLPGFLDNFGKLNGHAEQIAGDIQGVADKVNAPRTKKQKVFEVLKLAGIIGARFIP